MSGDREEIAAVAFSPIRIGLAQTGDRRALEQLLVAIREPLFHHIRRIVGDGFSAEDVLQEALFTICRTLPSLREPKWFRAWAYRIATRQAVRRGKRERFWMQAERDEELEGVAPVEETELFEPEMFDALGDAVSGLPPACQLVLRMHYHDELTFTEIAEALEIPVGTVKSRAAYGLGSLRKRLAHLTR